MSLCRRIFPSHKIVSSRHIRNAKVFVRTQHFHKVDVIFCIDEYRNALYLAEGDAGAIFKLKWSEHGEYDLDGGKIPHRVKSSRILEKQKSSVRKDETKSDTNWKKRRMTMSNAEISPRKKRKYESLKDIIYTNKRIDETRSYRLQRCQLFASTFTRVVHTHTKKQQQ